MASDNVEDELARADQETLDGRDRDDTRASRAPLAPAAPAAVTGTALLTLDPEQYVTAVFAPFRDRLEIAKTAAAAIKVVDVTTSEGMKTAIVHRATFRALRVEAEKARLARKRPILDIGKLLDTRHGELEAEITPLEDRFDTAIKAEEQRKEAAKAAAAQAEHERIERIQSGIRDMRGSLIDVAARPSAVIEAKIIELVAIDISRETVQEFVDEAEAAREQTLAKLRDMKAAAVAQEAEAERLRAEREELDRLRAEQAERERQERERQATDQRRRDEEEAQRQRAAHAHQMAMQEISGIQQQVIIAQIGRLGVRVGGTVTCIRETLAETEAWPIDPERFGVLTGSATQAKEAAVASIRQLLTAAEAQEAEAARIKEAQDKLDADRREIEERQRQEREAVEAKARAARDALEAREREERLALEQREREQREAQELAERQERDRIAAENEAREAEERKVREEAEAREREAVRLKLERADIRDALSGLRKRAVGLAEFAWFVKAYDRNDTPKRAGEKATVEA